MSSMLAKKSLFCKAFLPEMYNFFNYKNHTGAGNKKRNGRGVTATVSF